LSIVSLLLVFSSNIVTLVHDVKAVNSFMAAGKAASTGVSASSGNATVEALQDFDYITYVLEPLDPFNSPDFVAIVEVQSPTNPQAPSGRS
jgi:hypothetical protein